MTKLFEYFGAKSYLVKDIMKEIAPIKSKLTCVVDVFGGSGAFILGLPQEWNVQRVYNDLDRWLYTTFRVIQDERKRQQLIEKLELSYRHRTVWSEFKQEYHEGDLPESDIEIAFRIVYLYQYGFNGSLTSFGINISGADREGDKMQASLTGIKLLCKSMRRKFSVDNLDFRELIKKWDSPTTLFYLDPPYLTGKKHYATGGGFSLQDFTELKAQCDSMQGYYLMNESDKDYEKLKPIWGEPQTTKEYANQIGRNFKDCKTSYRHELFYHNFQKLPPITQAIARPAGQKPIGDTNVVQ